MQFGCSLKKFRNLFKKKIIYIFMSLILVTLMVPSGLNASASEFQLNANATSQQHSQDDVAQNESETINQENFFNIEHNQSSDNVVNIIQDAKTEDKTANNNPLVNQTAHLCISSDDGYVHQKLIGEMKEWDGSSWITTIIDSETFETDVDLGTKVSANNDNLLIVTKNSQGEDTKYISIMPVYKEGFSFYCYTINGEKIEDKTITIGSADLQEIKVCYDSTIVNLSNGHAIDKFKYEIVTDKGTETGEESFCSLILAWGAKYTVDSNGVVNIKGKEWNSNGFIKATFTPIANEQYVFDNLTGNGRDKKIDTEYTIAETSNSTLNLIETFKLRFDIQVFSEDTYSKFEVYDNSTGQTETTTAKWRDTHLDKAQENLYTINLNDAEFYVDNESNWLTYSWCSKQSVDCLSNYKFTYLQSEAYVPIWQYKKGNEDWNIIVPGDMPIKFENSSYQFKLSFKEQHIPIKVSCDNELVHKKFGGSVLEWVDGNWIINDIDTAVFEGEVELGTQVYASGNELCMITRDDEGETRKMIFLTPANDFDYFIDYYTLNGKKVGHDITTITSTDFKDFKAFYKTTNFNITGDENLNTFKYNLDYNGTIYSGEKSSVLVPVMWDSVYYVDDNGALHVSYLNIEEEFDLYYDAELVPVAKDGFELDTITVNGNVLEKGSTYEVKATETGNLNFVANFRSTEKPVPPTPTADYPNTSIVDGPSTKTADFNYIVVVLLAIVASGPIWYISRKRKA